MSNSTTFDCNEWLATPEGRIGFIIAGVALVLSEILALIPGVPYNGILQTLVLGLSKIAKPGVPVANKEIIVLDKPI